MSNTARRRARAFPAVAAGLVALSWLSTGVAGAAISSASPFAVSPASGPPGTVVNVNGKECSPGSTNSAASDYVAINAPELQVTDMQVPVHQNGSWHGSFRVPAGTNAGIAATVAAMCVTDTLPSLSTWYMPQTFTVTAPAPTTTTTPTTTAPGGTTPTTPTTKPPTTTTPPTHGGGPSPDGGGAPGSTSPVFGGFPPGPASGNAGGGTGKSGSAPTGSSTAKGRTAAARAADLSVPELPSARVAGPSGLGWLSWVLLCALIVGAIGAPLWLRRSRRSVEEDDGIAAVGTL